MNCRTIIALCSFFLALILQSCNSPNIRDNNYVRYKLCDKNATSETIALYRNLHALASDHIIFGQQDALAYGVGRRRADTSFCDVYDVTGSYPALTGWDIGHIEEESNIDSIPFKKIIRLIKAHYRRGGVITISWHELHPKPGIPVWDSDPAPQRLVPGGDMNESYRNKLKHAAHFFNQLKDKNNRPIPVLFRPFHEHNGDWFWWGVHNATEQEYKNLWRYTVEFLRDSLDIHHLLYVYSPDRSSMKTASDRAEFLYGYPGDNFVDVIGLDNYWDVGKAAGLNENHSRHRDDSLFLQSLRTIVAIAEEKNKIAALTETGLDRVPEPKWFTDRLLDPLEKDTLAGKIAYLQVWRNAWKSHFYVPYPGHPAVEDFIDFRQSKLILFEDELPPMYH